MDYPKFLSLRIPKIGTCSYLALSSVILFQSTKWSQSFLFVRTFLSFGLLAVVIFEVPDYLKMCIELSAEKVSQ